MVLTLSLGSVFRKEFINTVGQRTRIITFDVKD